MITRRGRSNNATPSAKLHGPFEPYTLEEQSFTPYDAPVGMESMLAEWEVPSGHVIGFEPKPMRIYVPATASADVTMAGGTPATVTVTFPARLAVSTRGAARDIFAVDENLVALPIAGYDLAAGTVTVDTSGLPDGTHTVTVWALPAVGHVSLRVSTPGGFTSRAWNVFTRPFALLYAVNQADARAGVYMPKPYVLPEHWKLQVWVKSPFVLDWGEADFEANAQIAPVGIIDHAQANREAMMQFK